MNTTVRITWLHCICTPIIKQGGKAYHPKKVAWMKGMKRMILLVCVCVLAGNNNNRSSSVANTHPSHCMWCSPPFPYNIFLFLLLSVKDKDLSFRIMTTTLSFLSLAPYAESNEPSTHTYKQQHRCKSPFYDL